MFHLSMVVNVSMVCRLLEYNKNDIIYEEFHRKTGHILFGQVYTFEI